jgi:hypothetical protein
MASTARIDGSLPDPGDNSTLGLVFSGAWGVAYEFAGTPAARSNQPHRLSAFGFPAPFDQDLTGALRGRGAFGAFLYLFKGGRYLRLDASTMLPDGPDAEHDTAPAWGLPLTWTTLDAVAPGRGSKIDFCYFLRGSEYVRFDWLANAASPGYPKSLGQEWQLDAPFDGHADGLIAGQDGLRTTGFLFRRLPQTVDDDGNIAASGHVVETPGFARYDFTAGTSQGTAVGPRDVSMRWGGLIPLLDAGPAIDLALQWCDAAILALSATPAPAILATAFAHHFMTPAPAPAQQLAIATRFAAVRARIAGLPAAFQWTRNLPFPAQTARGFLTEIGDDFSNIHGPNGRAAVLIHEAVHFTFSGVGQEVDVPEWSGETINGQTFGISPVIPGVLSNIAYAALTTDQAIENPGSYASFAQEIFFGQDNRFGIARRHE